VIRPGGKLSSLGVYSGKLEVPLDAFGAGIADIQILTTLCPGGKERMRRLMDLVASHRLNLRLLLTHDFGLENIANAYDVFGKRKDGVLKVAVRPGVQRAA
jgi:threonine dehydrogenase-like Zn-dependent dehydrogenase